MSDQEDPGANTEMFRAYVEEQRSRTRPRRYPLVLSAAAAVVVAIAVVWLLVS